MFLTLLVRLMQRLRQRKKFRGLWEPIWFIIVLRLAMIELELVWFWLPLWHAAAGGLIRVRRSLGFEQSAKALDAVKED